MAEVSTVLVYGATGGQTRHLVTKLLERGLRVRALVRDRARAAALETEGAELVSGDFTDARSLKAATAGVDAVFLLVPFLDPNPAYARAAIDAALAEGVKGLVWNATGPVPPTRTGNPGIDARRVIAGYLAESGLPHTILQPTAYMENWLLPALVREVVEKSTFAYPIPATARMQWISHLDVASFAVEALTREVGSTGRFVIAGPDMLTLPDIAAGFSRGLGRQIGYRSMEPAEFGRLIDAMYGPGAGEGIAAFYAGVFDNPALFSSNVALEPLLEALPIRQTTVEGWARMMAATYAG